MKLIYRGHQYTAKATPKTVCTLEFPCVYRGTPYQIKTEQPVRDDQQNRQTVQLKYRGVAYTRALIEASKQQMHTPKERVTAVSFYSSTRGPEDQSGGSGDSSGVGDGTKGQQRG